MDWGLIHFALVLILIAYAFTFSFQENKSDEDDNLPSMESLEISKKSSIKRISSYMGPEDDEDIPDMAEFDDNCNLIENDPVS